MSSALLTVPTACCLLPTASPLTAPELQESVSFAVCKLLHDHLMEDMAFAQRHSDLSVHQNAFEAACSVQQMKARFPAIERYSLTDQLRRSSRSVCANIAEAWRKRLYPNHFVSKLSDADAECAETQTWLDFAKEFGYLDMENYARLSDAYQRIGKQLGVMLARPESWTRRR